MKLRTWSRRSALVLFTLTGAVPGRVDAQVAKGLVDPNVAVEKDLLALPHLAPAVVKGILEKRPFKSILELDAFLGTQSLTPQQRAELYGKAFIHINLNTATADEILLIPGAGRKMAHEFEEYRPWKSFAQFDKEIGKYVDAAQVARLKQYTFIPIDLNTARDEDILSIPGLGPRLLHEFKEYRPYKAIEQFRKEIGKYVNEKEVGRLERYVTIGK
jgi:DNA uptake protein ComE-like DNA-binding protein